MPHPKTLTAADFRNAAHFIVTDGLQGFQPASNAIGIELATRLLTTLLRYRESLASELGSLPDNPHLERTLLVLFRAKLSALRNDLICSCQTLGEAIDGYGEQPMTGPDGEIYPEAILGNALQASGMTPVMLAVDGIGILPGSDILVYAIPGNTSPSIRESQARQAAEGRPVYELRIRRVQ